MTDVQVCNLCWHAGLGRWHKNAGIHCIIDSRPTAGYICISEGLDLPYLCRPRPLRSRLFLPSARRLIQSPQRAAGHRVPGYVGQLGYSLQQSGSAGARTSAGPPSHCTVAHPRAIPLTTHNLADGTCGPCRRVRWPRPSRSCGAAAASSRSHSARRRMPAASGA
jgi:hypothetical protein